MGIAGGGIQHPTGGLLHQAHSLLDVFAITHPNKTITDKDDSFWLNAYCGRIFSIAFPFASLSTSMSK